MLALAAVAVVAALLVFGGGLALNVSEHRLADAKLEQLAQDIVRLQEVERARVSRELHDGISQVLVSIKFRFELAQEKLLRGAGDPQPELAKGISGLVDAIAEIRRISHDLRPSLLDDLGLASAIKQLAGDFSSRTGIAARVDIERYEGPVGGEEAVSLFRIAQEALTNIERHAAASEVSIVLSTRTRAFTCRSKTTGAASIPRSSITRPIAGSDCATSANASSIWVARWSSIRAPAAPASRSGCRRPSSRRAHRHEGAGCAARARVAPDTRR